MKSIQSLAALTLALSVVACGEQQQSSPDAGCVPAAELCNGLDDDCDGETDDGFAPGENCSAGVGACAASGVLSCSADGTGTRCSAQPGLPSEELCNGVDDDCDGETDEAVSDCCSSGDSRACGVDVGACGPGSQSCSEARSWGGCLDVAGAPVRQPGEVSEDCNGIDDDCDGATDEEIPDVGGQCDGADADLCREGILECRAGEGLACSDPDNETVDLCNGLDDDCDGETDDDFAVGASCGEGICFGGTRICAQDGSATDCSSAEQAQPEVCNGLDDDCDGETDESC